MATITITDLPVNRDLDCQAMSAIRGAGAGDWVFGIARPYVKAPARPAQHSDVGDSSITLYQVTNNNYFIENKTINLLNTATNSTVNAVMISS